MSLQSWKDEFYPVEAENVKKNEAIQHALTKWIGLRKKNLKKHNLHIDNYREIVEYKAKTTEVFSRFHVDGESCSLCWNYLYKTDNCFCCPISGNQRRGINCSGQEDSAFTKWLEYSDPEPMIKVLQKAMREQEKK